MKKVRKLSPEQKAENARQRQIHECMKSKPKYQANVAKEFQRMIRCEAAAVEVSKTFAVVNGDLIPVDWRKGYCVCITCGISLPWTVPIDAPLQMQTGHFLGGRLACILFEEDNVAPQCSTCNKYGSGKPLEFRKWMEGIRGIETIERLEDMKRKSISLDRETLVDMRLEFSRRLKAAALKMKGTT